MRNLHQQLIDGWLVVKWIMLCGWLGSIITYDVESVPAKQCKGTMLQVLNTDQCQMMAVSDRPDSTCSFCGGNDPQRNRKKLQLWEIAQESARLQPLAPIRDDNLITGKQHPRVGPGFRSASRRFLMTSPESFLVIPLCMTQTCEQLQVKVCRFLWCVF